MYLSETENRETLFNSVGWKIQWPFPAVHAHNGIPLGNGMFGVLIHGQDNILKFCINRADFWDHRRGLVWDERMSYKNVKRCLEEGNQEELNRIFARVEIDGMAGRPTHLPMGRYEMIFEEGSRLVSGSLNLSDGEAAVIVEKGEKRSSIHARMVLNEPVIAVRAEGEIEFAFKPVPVTKEGIKPRNGEPSSPYTVPYPYLYNKGEFSGWCQELPIDPALAVLGGIASRDGKKEAYLAAARGECVQDAVDAAIKLLENCKGASFEEITLPMAKYWWKFWGRSALVKLEDKEIEKLYYLGIYKMASISMAGGPPSTTQGPWIEDYRMPAWSSDYHFNVNVQECYWPAYASNNLEVLEPLLKTVDGWIGKLKEYAKIYVGIEDGIQIPWAVDDLCTSMGGTWAGAIDHGSTAWFGYMMWQYYRYSMDEKYLKDSVYPFLRGAFRVYQEMLEWDGGRYQLPVTVSSEFKWGRSDCWGANGTFQLTNIHFLCRSLVYIIEKFGIEDPIIDVCRHVQKNLPLYSKGRGKFGDEIYVWDGQPLSESHRHHSHLAGIYPYDLLSYSNESDRKIIDSSFKTWAYMGMGAWTGWCVPWAVILHARTGNGDMAEMLLQIFRRAFLMNGYASSHDAQFKGFTIFEDMVEVMQVEASIAVADSILEMLMFTSNSQVHVFPAMPGVWQNAAFSGIRAEGGFLIDGELRDGKTEWIRIKSECGQTLNIKNPFGSNVKIKRLNENKEEILEYADSLTIYTKQGDCFVMTKHI